MKALALASVLLLSTATLANCGGTPPDIDKGSTADSVKDSSIAAQNTTTTGSETASTTTVEDSAAPPATEATTGGNSENEAIVRMQKDIDEAYQKGYDEGYQKAKSEGAQTLWITGEFTATVRAILPDFVADPENPRSAVITFFQEEPILVHLKPEQLKTLKEGETYTFVLSGLQVAYTPESWNAEDDWVDDSLLNGLRLDLKEIREPSEDELGLRCNRMHAVDNTNAVG